MKKALIVNFFISLTALFGTILALGIGKMGGFEANSVAFACGQFLYLALTMLLPQVKSDPKNRVKHFVLFVIGIAIMAILLVFPHSHGDEEGGDHAGHNH